MKMLLPRWDSNISVFANKMKPFCTLGHGQASFPILLCLLKTEAVLSAQPCPSHEGLSATSLPGEGFLWASLPLLEANLALFMAFANSRKPDPRLVPIRVTPISFYQLPAWMFVRCRGTGGLQSYLLLSPPLSVSLFFFLELKEVWQL